MNISIIVLHFYKIQKMREFTIGIKMQQVTITRLLLSKLLRMKICLLLLGLIFVAPILSAQKPGVLKTPAGIIIYTDSLITGKKRAVKVDVVADNIIHISAFPSAEIKAFESLILADSKKDITKWSFNEDQHAVHLKTKKLIISVNLKSGAVSFADNYGKKILQEEQINGREFTPGVAGGKAIYQLKQTFQTTKDDAYYGLGQHQDGVFNYAGQQVNFFQNNTEVAIPFLISRKNYGILWDNYSLTSVGDVRSFQQLSALQLFSKKGDEGFLTATYTNDKNKPSDSVFERAESSINMEFLGDSKMMLPQAFNPATGKVTWEGSIASSITGLHKLKFIYGGYFKVWLNDSLKLDLWRKAWNPAPALLDLYMQAGQKIPVKIEWIPEGAESYLAAKYQPPVPAADHDKFAFNSKAGQQIDYYFVYGKNMDEVIGGYRTLTGKAPIVPKWALGFWQSRERYKTQDEILATVAEFRKRQIPLDNIVLDWSYWKQDDWGSQDFDASRFANPDSMIKVLHNQYNTQIMISVWPKFYEGITAYNDFNNKGWLYKRNIADRQRDWIGKGYISTFYDAFNADARKGFWDLIHKKIYTKGFDAWWMDASEPDILSNVSPEKRIVQMTPTAVGPAAEYLNAYPLQNAKGIYEGQRSVDPDKRVFLLTRSGFAGSQQYAAAIWSGDISARWHDMKTQISAGINFSMSGLPYWTMDIGGFVVENRFEKPNATDLEEWREQMTRWYQFGAFVPLFRSHGQFPYREVFNLAPESHPAYQSIVYYDKLRYRLMPYIYSLAGQAYHNNYTLMRGLVMDFSSDTVVNNIGDQFMFGPSLLVNPVYNYKERQRLLYLPAGQGWYDLYSGKYFKGGQHIIADAPYEKMPVYVKEGSIIPFGPEIQYTSQKKADTITLYVYTGRNAAFTLYEDEGLNYNYEKGRFSNIDFEYNQAAKALSIGQRQGSFDGMLKERAFVIKWINPSDPQPMEFNKAEDKIIIYTGKNVVVKQP